MLNRRLPASPLACHLNHMLSRMLLAYHLSHKLLACRLNHKLYLSVHLLPRSILQCCLMP
jgi:hypothetical protein